MNSGGGQGAGGSGAGGGAASVYLPRNQGGADETFWKSIDPLVNSGISGAQSIGHNPAAFAYPQAQDWFQYGLGNLNYADQARGAAQTAYGYGADELMPQAVGGSRALYGAAMGGMPYASAALNQGFDPAFQQVADYAATDPWRAHAIGGAVDAATMGGQGAAAMQNLGTQIGAIPAQLYGMIPELQGMGRQVGSTINPLIQSGFDPQSALFNRSQSQLMDQTNAINAMSGLAGTPYGASVQANAMGKFGNDWQNQQLARQAQASNAAGQAGGQAANIFGQAGTLGTQAGTLGTQAGNLYQAAPGLAATSAGLPSSVYQTQLRNTLAALDARNKAGLQGAAGWDTLLGRVGTGIGQGQTIGGQGATSLGQLGMAPYQAGATIANNALQGLNQQTNIGSEAFKMPQTVIGDLLQYLGAGQTASQLSGNLGQQGFNQTSQGIGGALSGITSLGRLAMTPFGAAPAGSLAGSAI